MDYKLIIIDLVAFNLISNICLFSDIKLMSMDHQGFVRIDKYVIVQ